MDFSEPPSTNFSEHCKNVDLPCQESQNNLTEVSKFLYSEYYNQISNSLNTKYLSLIIDRDITIFIIAAILITSLYYVCFIKTFNWTMDLSDIGHDFLWTKTRWASKSYKKLLVENIRKLRKVGDIPPVYPNGWFALLESSDLSNAQVKYVPALGEHFAVFRTKKGNIKILDAYCPHLGANIAVGGVVHGNCLECPFHGWKFDGDNGLCVEIPYSNCKIPSSAKIKVWLAQEVNGYIFVWYHAEDEKPYWYIEQTPEIANGKWRYRGRNEFTVSSHIQEIPENGADVAHLNVIHTQSMLCGNNLVTYNKSWLSFCKHRWSAKWQENQNLKHTASIDLIHEMILFDKINILRLDVNVKQIGPSYVELLLNTVIGPVLVTQTVTPIEPMLQKIIHRVYCPLLLSPYATLILYGETIMVGRDVMVWNHKKYTKNPMLVKEDQTIQLYRRWYSQFYSENSPKFTFQQVSLEW